MSTWATVDEMERYVRWFTKWSGLSEDFIRKAINREPDYYYPKEYDALAPKTKEEQDWFYRTSTLYMFHLASHTYWQLLDTAIGPVLDFGGGIGNNFFPLLQRGLEVHYFDISLPCTNFVRWRLNEEGMVGRAKYQYRILSPFDDDNKFTYIDCIRDNYNSIIMQDVIEHCADYEALLAHLLTRLNSGGLLFEETWFEEGGGIGKGLHLQEKTPLSVFMAMHKMVPVQLHVWRKL